eukprot:6486253-Amphidinium_carterae.1
MDMPAGQVFRQPVLWVCREEPWLYDSRENSMQCNTKQVFKARATYQHNTTTVATIIITIAIPKNK